MLCSSEPQCSETNVKRLKKKTQPGQDTNVQQMRENLYETFLCCGSIRDAILKLLSGKKAANCIVG